MPDLMPLQQENREEILRIFSAYGDAETELARFLMWLRSRDQQFEAYDVEGKRVLLDRYIKESFGPKKFRTGRDG